MKITLLKKIALPFILIAVIVLGVFASVYWMVDRNLLQLAEFREQMNQVDNRIERLTTALQGGILTQQDQYFVSAARFALEIEAGIVALMARDPELMAGFLPRFYQFYDGLVAVSSVFSEQRLAEGQARLGELDTARADMSALVAGVNAELAERYQATTSLLNGVMLTAAVLLLLALAGGLWVVRILLNPVYQMQGHFEAIANGKLDNPITSHSRDEIGDLQRSLAAMQSRLKANIAEREQSEAENQRLHYALDSVSAAVMVADTQGRLIYVNGSALQLFRGAGEGLRQALPGFDPERMLGGDVGLFQIKGFKDRLAALNSVVSEEVDLGGHTFKWTAGPIFDAKRARLGSVIEWVDRTDELSVEHDVMNLVERAAMGDLAQRIATEHLHGFFKRLGEGVNLLVERTQTGLGEVEQVLQAVAQGDLTELVEGDYEGTFAQLQASTNHTVDELKQLLATITEASDAINTGAREIASGNADLSQRTEEQASSLEETASSMEQLTATVKQNADNAREADQVALQARQVALGGGQKIQSAITAMQTITESSQKISEIISVIDGIAFQTNILALNAAVEAARAGEQGRGFAVVALEVRNLAQRSASAAKEIKGLLNHNAKAVDSGSTLVLDAGKTMDEIVQGVQRVSALISAISTASSEQSSGIEQVNIAVTQMDEMTQQNASLVEQAAAAAESLEEQTVGLNRSVRRFRF